MKTIRADAGDYAELLGLYLGDGSISRYARTYRLRITLDQKYPRIVEAARGLLARCFVENSVGLVERSDGCSDVSVYHSHLPCLIPQHGSGPKHDRDLSLESWQQTMVTAEPERLLRGLFHSDGCYFVNRTGPYRYPSYQFANRSKQIIDLFVEACSGLGATECRVTYSEPRRLWTVRVNRRAAVAKLAAVLGEKA